MLQVVVKGLATLRKDLKAESEKEKKALDVAIRVEGFRQLKTLRDDIKHGRPGGKPYAAKLSYLSRRVKFNNKGQIKLYNRKNLNPLYRLAGMLRYNVAYSNGAFNMWFGFVRNTPKIETWKERIIKHQLGTDILYDGSRSMLGKRLAQFGGMLKKKGDPEAKFFFLRKSTNHKIDLPKREMIDPFWDAHKAEATKNISVNFRRKLRGERI